MGKSLALSSNGLGFDEFMKAIVRVQPEKTKPMKEKPKSQAKGERARNPRKA
jgi:hypothetical protein